MTTSLGATQLGATALKTYYECPRLYKHLHIDGWQSPKITAFDFGGKLADLVAVYRQSLANGLSKEVAIFNAFLLFSSYPEQIFTKAKTLGGLWQAVLAEITSPIYEEYAFFEVEYSRHLVIKGQIIHSLPDMLLQNAKGEIFLYDDKTSTGNYPAIEHDKLYGYSFQSMLYAYVLSKLGIEVKGIVYCLHTYKPTIGDPYKRSYFTTTFEPSILVDNYLRIYDILCEIKADKDYLPNFLSPCKDFMGKVCPFARNCKGSYPVEACALDSGMEKVSKEREYLDFTLYGLKSVPLENIKQP